MNTPLRKIQLTIPHSAFSGNSASASGHIISDEVRGWLVAVHLTLPTNPSATGDFSLNVGDPALPVWTATNRNTNGWFHPAQNNQRLPLLGALTFGASQARNQATTLTVIYEEVPF